ncbi:hypothetical protein V5799_004480 [Amblyomma americanum]|uniref:Uncharacterized protein n=1 Tax=Amblyomma americanum TaxID=6943 RepID=A0AAQ4D5Z8_AMBAM
MGFRPTRPTTPPLLTTDPIWLTTERQGPCQDQFPVGLMTTGSSKRRASTILCIFNTSTHNRPFVSRMVLGLIPGLICKHVIYASVQLPGPDDELQSSTPEFDTECGGLSAVQVLKKRYQSIKSTELQNYDIPHIASRVDWLIVKTHGYYPRPGYQTTICSSPWKDIKNGLKYLVANLTDNMDLSHVCFTVSFRATGYHVVDKGFGYYLKTSGPGNLNRYTGDDGVIAYRQVCKSESIASRQATHYCSYVR